MTQAPFLPLSTVPTSSYDKHSSRGSTQFCDRKLGPSHVVVAFCLFWAMLPSNTIIGVTISFRSFSSISHTVSNHIISDKIIVGIVGKSSGGGRPHVTASQACSWSSKVICCKLSKADCNREG